jgi:hypothetical protein
MHCDVYGRLYWQAPAWRLDLQDASGVVTETLEIPVLATPFSPPPVPSKSEATVCIITTLRRSYDVKIVDKIRVEQSGSLPDYHFIATYMLPSYP